MGSEKLSREEEARIVIDGLIVNVGSSAVRGWIENADQFMERGLEAPFVVLREEGNNDMDDDPFATTLLVDERNVTVVLGLDSPEYTLDRSDVEIMMEAHDRAQQQKAKELAEQHASQMQQPPTDLPHSA